MGDADWRDAVARRQANAAVILAKCSSLQEIAPLLNSHPDRRATCSYLVDRLALAQPPVQDFIEVLKNEEQQDIRQNLLLSMAPLLQAEKRGRKVASTAPTTLAAAGRMAATCH